MITYHWNGEHWYKRDHSLLKRFRRWLLWVGGWELTNGAGWKVQGDPHPISLVGHRVTLFGDWMDIRTPWGIFVCGKDHAFFSPDGTPGSATTWLRGAPQEVLEGAEQWERELKGLRYLKGDLSK